MVSKIPLFKAKKLGYERDMISMRLRYGNLPDFTTMAIVDTGCPFIIISKNDIDKTRIPYQNKESLPEKLSLGNILLELKDLGICDIFLKDENNNSISFKEQIFVGIPILQNKFQMLGQQLPSMFGKNFLDKHLFL